MWPKPLVEATLVGSLQLERRLRGNKSRAAKLNQYQHNFRWHISVPHLFHHTGVSSSLLLRLTLRTFPLPPPPPSHRPSLPSPAENRRYETKDDSPRLFQSSSYQNATVGLQSQTHYPRDQQCSPLYICNHACMSRGATPCVINSCFPQPTSRGRPNIPGDTNDRLVIIQRLNHTSTQMRGCDRLSNPEVRVSIPCASKFSVKQWVWNGVKLGLVRTNDEQLE
uniref:Uncharacterized protein n=1 Tax=Timema douglasi TaxID=61478 RepID=A0A7R8VB79_TIMDO|nr:unnamed protein product [Timema douglasi]